MTWCYLGLGELGADLGGDGGRGKLEKRVEKGMETGDVVSWQKSVRRIGVSWVFWITEKNVDMYWWLELHKKW